MIKRILSLLLAVSLMGGAVVSCGGQNKPELSRVTNVYQSTDVTLPDNISVSAMYMTEEGLLIRATEVLDEGPYENRAQAEAARREVLLDFDIDTGDYTVEPLPKMKSGSYLNFVLPQDDGTVLAAVGSYDEEAGTALTSLIHWDGETMTTICEDVEAGFSTKAEDTEFGFGDFYIQSIQTDNEGNICIATDSVIGVFDPSMKKLFEVELPGWLDDMGKTADGRVWARFYDRKQGGQVFKYLDTKAKGFGEDVPMPKNNNFLNAEFYLGPGYDMYINDGNAVYGYTGGSEPTVLLDWVNSDIIANGIQDLIIVDADTFVANYYEYSEEGSIRELYILKRVPDEEVPERYIIDLAVNYVDYDLPSYIVRFNRANDKYRIRLTDYSAYNTEENRQLAEETLYNEISAGTGPDLVMLSGFSNQNQLLTEGVFADLYGFMDKDEEFDRADLYDSVLNAYESDGELPVLVTKMQLMTLVGKTTNLPGESWTADAFLDWAEGLSDGQYTFSYSSSLQMLNALLCCSLGDFIDADTGAVNFDTPTFRRMLEFAKNTADFNYRDTLSGDELMDYDEDRYRPYRENVILLEEAYLYDLGEMVNSMFTFGFEDTTFIGYPSSQGSGVVIQPSESYAILKDSPVGEGAWEFIKSMFSPNSYSAMRGRPEICASRSRFRESVKQELEMHYFYYYNGGRSGSSGDDFFTRHDESEGIFRDFTQADVTLMESLIDSAVAIPSYFEKVAEILMEELEMYFAGDKSLDETVSVIQGRVSIYIAEIG
ncbi:MAG: extracellular solute-binding protein [Ruminococcaceae bacterium]|nr:extracellular solute-binding protein [Oscillospiraceae bacterium]